MACLRRSGAAGHDERGERDDGCARREDPCFARQHHQPSRGGDEHGREDREAGREVSGRLPDVLDDVEPTTRGNARVEAAREDEVGQPERDPEHGDGTERPSSFPQPLAPRDRDEGSL
jgi:hypothetical protein